MNVWERDVIEDSMASWEMGLLFGDNAPESTPIFDRLQYQYLKARRLADAVVAMLDRNPR